MEAQMLQWHCGELDKTHFKSKSIKEERRKSLYKKKRKELADNSSLKLVQTQQNKKFLCQCPWKTYLQKSLTKWYHDGEVFVSGTQIHKLIIPH